MRGLLLNLIALAAIMTAGSAEASMILIVDDLNNAEIDLRIEDGDPDDASPAAGIISFSGSPSPGISLNVIALSKPFINSDDPGLRLNVFSFASLSPVKISLADTSFANSASPADVFIDGAFTTSEPGLAAFEYFYGSSNGEFERTDSIVDCQAFILPEIIDELALMGSAGDVGSLTIDVDWDVEGGLVQGNFVTQLTLERTVPEPGTAALLAVGLAGLGFMGRRKTTPAGGVQ